jgi:pimeloyl-ACP methyl ester carboxylesterase
VVRFNFVHSGMTRFDETFERPDLFALDTWNRQISDLEQLIEALKEGRLSACPANAPVVLFGHSRGGLASILAAGRGLEVDAVVSASAPRDAIRFTESDLDQLQSKGVCPVESSRTGQVLSVGRHFLDEVQKDPKSHDPCLMARNMPCPLVLVHGDSDQTVSCHDATALAQTSGATVHLVPGGNHVFNVTNPFEANSEASPQLAALESVLLETLRAAEEHS